MTLGNASFPAYGPVLRNKCLVCPMFKPQDARREFEAVLRSRDLHERDLDPVSGCEALFDFYRDKRPGGPVFEHHEDADMLLFQWGTYDWGTGEQFSLSLTRQIIRCENAEDEDFWQLSLTFEFEADDELIHRPPEEGETVGVSWHADDLRVIAPEESHG